MAKEPDPDSHPVTVDDLMARTNPDPDAFPRSGAPSANRATASGMPGYTPPATGAQRVVGASGMPAFAPATGAIPTPAPSTDAPAESANVVTGIIPVVDDAEAAGGAHPVAPDDLVGVELPAMEVHGIEQAAAGQAPAVDQAAKEADAAAAASALDAAAAPAAPAAPVVDDAPAAEPLVAKEPEEIDDDLDAEEEPAKKSRFGFKRGKKSDEATEAVTAVAATGAVAAATDETTLIDTTDAEDTDSVDDEAKPERSALWQWMALIGEVVLGLLVGAGLFWGFTILWEQYVYFALVLAVLVIFAIVTFAYVLRKRDLPTTLLALAVGLLVTIGPLVLLV